MGTRCNIILTEKIGRKTERIYLYHHYDGYPEGVGTDLHSFLEKKGYFKPADDWGFESSLVIANELVKGKIYSQMYEKDDDAYEVTSCLHGDIEYLYVIDSEKGTLECYEALDSWKTLKDIIKPENLVHIPTLAEKEEEQEKAKAVAQSAE